MELWLLWAVLAFCISNFVLLFFLGLFVVRSHEQSRGMIGGLAEMIAGAPEIEPEVPGQKTWDQQYEEELEAFSRRIRGTSGLADLPSAMPYNSQVPKDPA